MSSSEHRRFLPRIGSMRGMAALTVALLHVTSSWVDTPLHGALDAIGLKSIKALSNGYGAVVAFFVISGFVLARSLDRDFDGLRFARARVFRLFPAAIAAIAIFAAAFYAFGFSLYGDASFTPLNIVANMLMLHVDIDRVMWSMKAELAATPLIFACVWLFRRYGGYPVMAIAGLLFGLSFVGQYCHAIGDDTNLAPLYAFPIGILLHFEGGAFAERLKPGRVTLAALISIGVFCASSFFKPTGTLAILAECVSAAILVMLIAYRMDTPVFVPLDLPVVRFYGRISYSFYLLHPLSLWATARLTESLLEQFAWLPMSVNLGISFAFSVAVVTPLAYASWRFVERPAISFHSSRSSRGVAMVSGDLQVTP